MTAISVETNLDVIREAAFPVSGDVAEFDPLMKSIGDARFVLIGEASHGTHEFYETRADLTRRLIEKKQFSAVAVEADWPDAHRLNRYVRGRSDDRSAREALGDFARFPTWMWRNTVVMDFIEWLRSHNESEGPEQQTGFYGLDLYSLNASIESVLAFLETVDPAAARRARYRYSCFEDYGENTQAYGYAASFDLNDSCEREVVEQLVEIRRNAFEYAQRDGRVAEDDFFSAEQNARLVRNAEEYYRSMFRGRANSWNLRDKHMTDTLQALAAHLEKERRDPKIVLWAHNSHLGDARATQMGLGGEWNVGQLVREAFPGQAFLIGCTGYTGTVTAASDWDALTECKRVNPALAGSYEDVFHQTGLDDFYLLLSNGSAVARELSHSRLERAIGVIYRPETERISHYFDAWLSDQFNAVIHLDETRALEPLDDAPRKITGEPAETYPSGQ